MAKNHIEKELIEGLQEVLSHKRGERKLHGRIRELPEPAPSWNARKIKHLRIEILELSQPEFAALLNVKTPTVRAWEQGHNIPSGAAARLLEVFLKDRSMVGKLVA
jgi:DNA-binding transcriptional regulator YiaG